jgi:non-canonical (house-cleaning) NTP pyrophosphatase
MTDVASGQAHAIVIAVGTENPCKIEAAKTAFEEAMSASENGEKASLPSLIVHAYSVPSGVSDQPIGDDETKQGAINRAQAAHDKCIKEHGACHFAIGLEGGIEYVNKLEDVSHMWCMAWMAILGSDSATCTNCVKSEQSNWPKAKPVSDGRESNAIGSKQVWGYGKTGAFPLPPPIVDLIQHHGMELGDADDKVFGRVNGKQGSGTVGILTNNMVDRCAYYVHALKLALIPWIWPELYIE